MKQFNHFMTGINFSALYDYCREYGEIVSYSRGDILVNEGEVCRYIGIIKSGYFKYVSIGSTGEEIVTGFLFADEVVTDYVRSFLYNEPSYSTIIAGSNAEVLQVAISAVRPYILKRNPGFITETSSLLLSEAYSRYLDIHKKTPSERYAELYSRFKKEINQVPFYEFASYLGVSSRQLQRIRRETLAKDKR